MQIQNQKIQNQKMQKMQKTKKEETVPITKRKLTVYQMALTGLMTAVLCVLGPVSLAIPVSPVPISLGSLAVYLTVSILGTRLGFLSCVLYLLLGLIGLPVFSGYAGGAGKLLGPTGGYLIGYLFLVLVSGFFLEHAEERTGHEKGCGRGNGKGCGGGLKFAGLLLGTGILYLFGTLWLSFGAGMSFYQALWAGVIPFIPGDIVKMLVALFLGTTVRGRLLQAGLDERGREKNY